MCQVGFGHGLCRGEAIDLVLLAGEPVLDGLQGGEVLLQGGHADLCVLLHAGGGIGRDIGCGQCGGLGRFVMVLVPTDCGLVRLFATSGEPASGRFFRRFLRRLFERHIAGAVARGLGVAVVAGRLLGPCLDEALAFHVESGHIVAARAGHEQGVCHQSAPKGCR